jgi:hypothetical protein
MNTDHKSPPHRLIIRPFVQSETTNTHSNLQLSTMKLDTRKDQPLTTTSTPTGCFTHKSRFVSPEEDRQDTKGLGRNVYYGTTVFFTPVLASERLPRDGRSCLLTSDGVDDLSRFLDSLSLDTTTKETKEKRGVSPSTERLILETPEACNPSFGRCKQTMADPKTNTLLEVTRSLRLTKSA